MAGGTTTRECSSGTMPTPSLPSSAWRPSRNASKSFCRPRNVPPRTSALSAAWTGQTSNQP
eukprot:3077790-Prymnesium_polylepis.1